MFTWDCLFSRVGDIWIFPSTLYNSVVDTFRCSPTFFTVFHYIHKSSVCFILSTLSYLFFYFSNQAQIHSIPNEIIITSQYYISRFILHFHNNQMRYPGHDTKIMITYKIHLFSLFLNVDFIDNRIIFYFFQNYSLNLLKVVKFNLLNFILFIVK